MISRAIIDELHCPYCEARLKAERSEPPDAPEILHGIVRCACYRYPILDGILILKQHSGPADTRDERVRYLEAGDVEQARHFALNCASPVAPARSRWQRAVEFGLRNHVPLSRALARLDPTHAKERTFDDLPPFRQMLEVMRPGLYGQYLFHRYANISFLASIAPLLLLRELRAADGETLSRPRRVLELTCGIGHSAFLIRTLFPSLTLIATDHDFVNLYLAQHYLASDATYLCLDAEVPLPFPDSYFDALFCLDGFHYLRSKAALVKELDRTLETSGLWLLAHLHNAKAENINPGIPLTSEDYLRRFAMVPARLLDEARVLHDFSHDGTFNLDEAQRDDEIEGAQAFALIASRRGDLWHKHRDLSDKLLQACSPLTINPIYRIEPRGDTLHLELAWPSRGFETECHAVAEYLPSTVELDTALLERLKSGHPTEKDNSVRRELMQSFVLVHLPRGYTESEH